MTNGITGYNSGGVNPYRPIEQSTDPSPSPLSEDVRTESARPSQEGPSLGAELSEAEAHMIGRHFPESEQMKLRLYGPGRPTTVDPGARGRRLDLLG